MRLFRYLMIDLQRAFCNKRFVFIAAVIGLALNYNCAPYSSAVEVARFMESSVFSVFAMSMAAIPYAASIVEDSEYKYREQMMLRGSRDGYIYSRIMAVYISAFITFLSGFLLFAGYNIIKIGVYNRDFSYGNMTGGYGAYLELFLDGHYYLYIFMCGVHLSALAGLMGVIGLFAGQIINNVMAVGIFPMVVISLQDIVAQRALGGMQSYRYSLRRLGFNMTSYLTEGNSVPRYYYIIICYLVVFVIMIKKMNKCV